jgi:predicted ester cyclase
MFEGYIFGRTCLIVCIGLSESSKALARRYFKAYETGNIDAVMQFIGSDYVLHPGIVAQPMNSVERKRDETVFFSAFSSIQTVVEDQIAEGDRVANRITMSCSHTGEYKGVSPTGKRVAIPYIDIILIKADKIVEEWVEYDSLSILQQIKSE